MSAHSTITPRFVSIFLATLLCIACYIRIHGADAYHLSPDEINHIEMAQGKTVHDVLRYSLTETHPPLGNILRHYWQMISDATAFQRGLSLLFGLALILVFYRMGSLLAGPYAGVCCAVLCAFSHGCILQSYLVRNYTIFLFFLSCCMVAWLHWRRASRPLTLAAYVFFACLAVLTHFSGLFSVLCIAAVEALSLLIRRAPLRTLAAWTAANAMVAAVAIGVMHFWQPLLAFAGRQMDTPEQHGHDIFYLLFAVDYLFAWHAGFIYPALLLALLLAALWAAARYIPAARATTALCLASLALGLALAFLGVYHTGVNRWCLWQLPFVLAPSGCALALAWSHARRLLPDIVIACLLTAACWTLYNPAARFNDANEYLLTESQWQRYRHALEGLGADTLIVAASGDAFLLEYPEGENLYAFYPLPVNGIEGAFAYGNFTLLRPWHHSHILFKPYYYHYDATGLIFLIKQAESQGLLKGIRTVVFPTTLWSRALIARLAECPLTGKKIAEIASEHLPSSLPGSESRIPALILEVPKDELLRYLSVHVGGISDCVRSFSPPPS